MISRLLISLSLFVCVVPISYLHAIHVLRKSHPQQTPTDTVITSDSPSLLQTSASNFDPIYGSTSFTLYDGNHFNLIPTSVSTTASNHVYYTIDSDTLARLQTAGIYYDGATGVFNGIINQVTVIYSNIIRVIVVRCVVEMSQDNSSVPTSYSFKQTQILEIIIVPRKPVKINGPTSITGRFNDFFPDTAVWSVDPTTPVQWSNYIATPSKPPTGVPYSITMDNTGRLTGRFPASGNITTLTYTLKASNADGWALLTITINLQPVPPSYLYFSGNPPGGNALANIDDGRWINMVAGAGSNLGWRYIRVVPNPGYSMPPEMARFTIARDADSNPIPTGMVYTIDPVTGKLELNTTSAIMKEPVMVRIRVTVTNPAGSYSIGFIVQILPPPPTIIYNGYMNGNSYTLKISTPIPSDFSNPPKFVTTGTPPITQVTITPSLPTGLYFNTNNYIITGMCTKISPKTIYTIEAMTRYQGGSVKGTFILECVPK